MKTLYLKLTLLAFVVFVYTGCNLVGNLPTISQTTSLRDLNLLSNPANSVSLLLPGVKRSLALGTMQSATISAVVSDDYRNITSFISPAFENAFTISTTSYSQGITNPYKAYLQVIGDANYIFSTYVPVDKTVTSDQLAELRWYKCMAMMRLGEIQQYTGWIVNQPPIDRKTFLEMVRDSMLALKTTYNGLPLTATFPSGRKNTYKYALFLSISRVYRLLGDKVNALNYADSLLTKDANYLYNCAYDAISGGATSNTGALNNDFAQYVKVRTDNAFQPLPRLDFLDPKYNSASPNGDPIPFLKAEEAYLIKAEVYLSNNDLTNTVTQLTNAVTLAKSNNASGTASTATIPSRSSVSYADNDSQGPFTSATTVKASPTSAALSGLTKQRTAANSTATYPLSKVSNTSVTAAMLTAASANRVELTRLLYLMRQEIFFGEGRRASDLGILLSIPAQDSYADTKNYSDSKYSAVAFPSYLPANAGDLDAFTTSGTVVTISFDVNQVIANNISSVSPFTWN